MSIFRGTSGSFRVRAALVLSLVVAASLPAAAQQPAAKARPAARSQNGAVKGPTVEGITQYTLPNGLIVLLFPDQSKQTATVNITYFVGSRNEGYGETGMAHLLEHMVFKGTPNHPDIPQELTEHGARPNGSTWFDRTNYFETFAATDSNLAWALDLEADRMTHSYVAKKDLESEMTVVRNEYESGENDPFGVLMERTLSTAFLWHNYGKSTIGARSDIEDVPIERLQAFYHKYYQPDNAQLVVAGKFDPARTLALIVKKFGAIPRPDRTGANKIYPTYTAEPTQDGERSVTLRRVGDVQVAMAVYHVPAGSDSDFAAVDVLSQVLGNAPSGRLYKALVEPKLAAETGAFDFQLKEPGVLLAYAQVRQEQSLDSARVAMEQALNDVVTNPPTAEEVDRAKATLLKNVDLELNASDRVGLDLSEWGSMGDWRLIFINRDRIRKVTPDDVLRVARAYLKPSNRTLGMFIPTPKPDRAVIPPVPDVAALVKDYKGDTTLAQGEAFDPSPQNIDRRTRRDTLASGLKVAFLPKQTRGNSVQLRMSLHFGSLPALMNRETAGDLAGDMLMRGTQHHTRQQIKDEFDRLKARALISGSVSGATATIETTRENLPAAVRLMAEVLKEPAFDAKEFDELKQERLSQLESQKSEPVARGFEAFRRHLQDYPKGDPRYAETTEEQVQSITDARLDDVKQFYQDFYGLGAGEIAVVGDFDSTAVRQIVADAFQGWKSPKSYDRVPSEFYDAPPTTLSIDTPDKANAFMLVGENLHVRDDNPEYPALVLGNYMLGGGFLNSRLAVRIRQKEGLSYGVGSGLGANSIDTTGIFQAYAIFAPQNVDKVETAMREEIARAVKNGFTPEEVTRAKEGYLQSREVSRSQDRELAGSLANQLFLDRTMAWDAAMERKVKALTPADIQQALQKYLDPARLTVVKAGDFKKKAPEATP